MTKLGLTPNDAFSLIGRIIKWEADIYQGNLGHFGYGKAGGVVTITKVDPTNRWPILEAEIHEGDNIRYAFNEWVSPGEEATQKSLGEFLCFSDSDRYISYEHLYEIPCKKCGTIHKKTSIEQKNPYGEFYTSCTECITSDDIDGQTENYQDHKAEINKIDSFYKSKL